MFILRAFARGADGVIICGCHPGDCHYTTGNYYTRRRLTLLMGMLNFMGVAESRLKVAWVSASEGARFAEVMTDFVNQITALGENVKLRDLRCKK
jgi:F420-non-reducing hydrogenase iron-sulfur subunit